MKTNQKYVRKHICLLLSLVILLSAIPMMSVNAAQVSYDVFAANTCMHADKGNVASVSLNENWNVNLVDSSNVSMNTAGGWWGTDGHWANANEITANALYSTNDGGYATFKVPSEEGAVIEKLIINTRYCASCTASFAVSNEVNGTYTDVYACMESNSGNDIEVDIASTVSGWSQVYVKVTFPETPCADWAALWNIRATGTLDQKQQDNATYVDTPVSYEVFSANICTYNANSGDVESVTLNSDWDVNLVSTDNVSMQNAAGWWGTDGHWANANNIVANALYSTNDGGSAIFKIPSDAGATITTLIVNGRNCMDTAVSFAISDTADGVYTEVYTVTSDRSGNDTEIDISAIASQWEQVYVKVIFPQTGCADWAALWNIRGAGTIKTPVETELVDVYCDVFIANDCTYNATSGNVETTTVAANWNANLVDSNNVSMQTSAGWSGTDEHWANPNAAANALYSTNDGGSATFVIPMEEGASVTKLIINGRYCMGTAVSFAVSNAADGSFATVYTVEEVQSGKNTIVDISDIATDWETVYVKVIFPQTGCADWAALWSIQAVGTKEVIKTDDPIEQYDPNPTDTTGTAVLHWKIGTEDQYSMTGEGVSRTTITAQAGSVSNDYNVLILGSGESITFTLPQALGTATNPTLELREIHKHGDGEVNFTVALNGESLLERVLLPVSEGPIHTWVDINKYDLTENNQITITNNGTQDVRLESIWFYENIDALMVEEDVYQPMEFVLFTLPISYSDYEADLAVVKSYKANYAGYRKYTIGMAFDIYYMKWEDKLLFERLDWLLQLSADSGVPLYLDLNSWWSGTPHGMDSLGGFWGDLDYQQVIYDPDNVNGNGVWQLSTPNMWGNTPWLSMNNAWYNQIRNLRLRIVSDYIAQKQAEYATKDTPVDVTIFMENEPTYWAYSHYNSSTVSGRADLSYTVIQDAASQGITLDPTDGLSNEELLWLFNNHTGYIEAEGDAVYDGLGNNSILIIDGQVTYPTAQMSEQVYSHVQTGKQTIGGITYPSWEYHITDNLRMGLEYAYPSEMSDTELQYVMARGTYADVNIERSAINNFNVISQLYKYGADHAILFNIHSDDYTLVAAQDSELSEIQEDVMLRTRCLWIACRADVERLLQQLEGSTFRDSAVTDLESAKNAYNNGRYETAYDLLMKIRSIADLPMDFTVSGTGKLLDYPVTISSDTIVNVTLYNVDSSLKLKLTSETPADVTVTWEGADAYTVTDLGNGTYLFTKGGSSSGSAVLKSRAYYEKDYPDAFEAVFIGHSDGYISITSQDPNISEYVDSVSLKLAENCMITRAQDGNEEGHETISIDALQNYDAIELTLNKNDEVVEIKATYGYITGRVVTIDYPVVDGTVGLSNPSITIKKADGTLHTFEICAITSFSYPTQTGNNMQSSSLTDYGLVEGDKIKLTYSPYTYGSSSIKAIKIYKDDYNNIVIDEDFEDKEFGENLSIENVHICDLDGNYHNQVVTAMDKNNPGVIIWEVQQEDDNALRDITIEYGSRNILGTAIHFYMSYDEGQTWELIGEGDCDSWTTIQQIFVDNVTANSVQIKCELDSRGTGDPDTWSSLDMIRVKIPSGDLVAAQAVDELILQIGTVTKNSKATIAAARSAYDALTDKQKEIVENDDILADAEKTYQAILDDEAQAEATEKADQKAANAVINLIAAIGKVSIKSENSIKEARTAYDALTGDQKALVTNSSKLVQAESDLSALKNQSNEGKEDDKNGDDDPLDTDNKPSPGSKPDVDIADNDTPKTGDTFTPVIWVIMLLSAAAAIIYLLTKKATTNK